MNVIGRIIHVKGHYSDKEVSVKGMVMATTSTKWSWDWKERVRVGAEHDLFLILYEDGKSHCEELNGKHLDAHPWSFDEYSK